MTRYTIVALPQKEILDKINNIRGYLYQNNFRHENKPLKDNSHVTLAQIEIQNQNDILKLKAELINGIGNIKKFEIIDTKLINREHKWIYSNPELLEKYPNGCARVALLFDSEELKDLAKICINAATKLGIDDSEKYASNIRNTQPKGSQKPETIDYLADHMNICNYARLEKANEAVEYFENNFDDKIKIDTIGLVSENQELVWEFKLSE